MLQRGVCSIHFTARLPCEMDNAMYTVMYFSVNYVTPLIIYVICFMGVLIVALKHMHRPQNNRQSTSTSPLQIIRSRAFLIVTMTVTSNVLLTAPYHTIVVLRKFGLLKHGIRVGKLALISFGGHLFTYNHFFNAVLYTIFIKEHIAEAIPFIKRRQRRAAQRRTHQTENMLPMRETT